MTARDLPATRAETPYERHTIGAVLGDRARSHPRRPFVTFGERTLSYGDVNRRAGHVAANLTALGVGRGDRVLLMLPNSPAFVLAMFGIARLGAVEVPINTAYKGDLLAYVLDDSEPAAVVVHPQWLPRLLPVIDGVPSVRALVVDGEAGDARSSLPARITVVRFDELLAEAPPPAVESARTDLSAIMYTSGTTGPSKGVQVTHAHQVLYGYDWAEAVDFSPDDVLLGPLPLFHALARTLGLIPTLLHGAHMAIEERFSARRFWDRARAVDATIAHGIFGMVPILLGQEPSPRDRDHRVRTFYIGPSRLTEVFRERFGAQIVEVFGATETGIVTRLPYGEHRSGSCGRPNAGAFEVRIADDDDEDVLAGEIGEILVRPVRPWAMMTGYWRKPEATAEAFRNLWFHTGDFGRFDADGYVYFVDRKKDAIRRRGENISSFEVEVAVNAHPAILESAAIAVPSELTEDDVKVCVVLQEGAALDHAEFIAFLDGRLPYFMVPRYVEVLEALPKTPNEKVRKVELRRMGRDGITDSTWDREAAGVSVSR
jgi:crotonobetaine/carnitine-CoA ligase